MYRNFREIVKKRKTVFYGLPRYMYSRKQLNIEHFQTKQSKGRKGVDRTQRVVTHGPYN